MNWQWLWQHIKRMNWVLTLLVIAMLVLGVFFIYSACYVSEDQPVRTLYLRQIVWISVGLAAYFSLAVSNYRVLRRWSWWFLGVSLILLVMVLLMGTVVYGAQRWLMVFGMGVQPSELAKLAAIIVVAGILGRKGGDVASWNVFWLVLLIGGTFVLLILQQPDLGTAIVFLPPIFMMMLVAGVPWSRLLAIAMLGVLGIALLLSAVFLPEKMGMPEETQVRIIRMVGLSPYHRDRLRVFIAPDSDPLGAGWNKRQSEIAVGSGGMHGKGFLKGTQNVLGFLPRSVAPTDFIFSVIAEEKGFIGSLFVLSGMGLILLLGLQVAVNAPDQFGRLVCVGVMTLLFCHVFINIAMTVGVMPVTGLPLPLLSYGGSFTMVILSSLGIVQSVHVHSRRISRFIVG